VLKSGLTVIAAGRLLQSVAVKLKGRGYFHASIKRPDTLRIARESRKIHSALGMPVSIFQSID